MPDSIIPAEWVARAQRDLLCARVLRSATSPLLEETAYFAAQAAEKALKAVLIKHSVSYRSFRHDVPALLVEAIAIEPSLTAFTPKLEGFDTYNVEARYPISHPFTTTEAQADEAIAVAEDLIAAISALI